MEPRETIKRFDVFLAKRGLSFSGVVVGGSALGLLGVISRQTKDCDILVPRLTPEILEAAARFATLRRVEGEILRDDWLNNGPASLTRDLPDGWEARLQRAFKGRAITLETLGRMDFIRSKVFALCDRATDLPDCIALAPSQEELDSVRPWLEEQDGNPDWPGHVGDVLSDLMRRLGHGV